MHNYTVILCSARTMDTEYDIAFHEGTVYMFEDTGLDVSHEVYGGREGQTACWGKNYGVSGQRLRRVGANYGVSGQITAHRGKLRRVGANYVVSRQITSCRGKLRHVRDKLRHVRDKLRRDKANYVVSGQIASCRGKLRRVGENYDVSGQFTSCRGKLRRHPCPQTSHNSSSTVYS